MHSGFARFIWPQMDSSFLDESAYRRIPNTGRRLNRLVHLNPNWTPNMSFNFVAHFDELCGKHIGGNEYRLQSHDSVSVEFPRSITLTVGAEPPCLPDTWNFRSIFLRYLVDNVISVHVETEDMSQGLGVSSAEARLRAGLSGRQGSGGRDNVD
ncbi:hypothetical protein MSAN_00165800 [Mycena sanguinolenta]|uniref:Uncharacterized protein n=1 Tax=Mycena sanguinolenta TaxID=230812 RepID=A0A8H7DN96_9AGAR|nr:hypothetical protein MSAN_00165800 [Mycena sanguinolenta]